MKKPTYIHYGSRKFAVEKFVEITNRDWNKPNGGLWASRIDAERGWKQWATDVGYCTCDEDNAFKFQLKASANVHHIYCEADLKGLPTIIVHNPMAAGKYFLDFEKLLASGVDAIEYHLSEQTEKDNLLYYLLFGWDCDSILILNKDIIEPV